MESCFYETIHETDLLHVRFELQDAPAFVFPAHWHEYVEILYLIRGQFSAIVQANGVSVKRGRSDYHQLRRPPYDALQHLYISSAADFRKPDAPISAGL